MFPNSDGVVQLGIVKGKLKARRDDEPYISKLGGTAAWIGGQIPSNIAQECINCRASLYLCAQVYAPVDFPRAIYIYGCLKPSCIGSYGSWRAYRTQDMSQPQQEQGKVGGLECEEDKADSEFGTSMGEAGGGGAGEGWGAAAGGDWGADDEGAGAWGCAADGYDDDEADMDKINSLLEKHEQHFASIPPPEEQRQRSSHDGSVTADASLKQEVTDDTSEQGAEDSRALAFPAMEITTMEEPWEDLCSKDSILAKLKKYQEEEEDEKIVKMIQQAMSASAKSRRDDSDDEEEDDADELENKKGRGFFEFQDRVGRAPAQVLRYAFAGAPLWSAPAGPLRPPAAGRPPPPCPACGAPRRFELQLMPAALEYLRFSITATGEERRKQNDPQRVIDGDSASSPLPHLAPPQEEAAAATLDPRPPPAPPAPTGANGGREEDSRAGGGLGSTGAAADGDAAEAAGAEERTGGGAVGGAGGEGASSSSPLPPRRRGAADLPEHLLVGASAGAAPGVAVDEGGMEWGVVAVWSCEASCAAGGAGGEEWVLVQAAV